VRLQKRLIGVPECKLVFKLDVFENIEAMLLTWQRTNVPDTSALPAAPPPDLWRPFYVPVPASPPEPAAHPPRAPGHTLTPLLSNMVASSSSTTARTPATSVRTPTPVNASSPQLVKSLKRKPEATPSANKRPRRPTVRDTRMTPQQIQQVQQQAAMQQRLNAQRTVAATAAPGVAQIRQEVNISQQQQRAGTPMSAAAANTATARMSPQQLAQAQACYMLQLQAAAQGAGAAEPLAGANGLAAHLSPPYAARAASGGSPGMPQAAAAPNAASPQPAQAQAQAQGMQRVQVLPMSAGQAAIQTYQAFSQDMLQEYLRSALAANAANTVRGVQGQPQVPVPVKVQFQKY
jgi:hypothetical protein